MAVTTGFQGRTFDVPRTGVPCIDPPRRAPCAAADAVFADAKAFLSSSEARRMSESELERELHRRGQELVRKLLQGHRDQRSPKEGCWSGRGQGHQRCRVLGAARARKPRRNGLRHDAGCGSGLRAARSRRLASARCRAEPAAGALPGRDAPPRDHRDRLAGTTAYALEATVVLDIIHVAAATRRAVLVAGSSKGLSAFGPRSDGRRPAHGDTWLQLRRSSAAAGSRSLDADCRRTWPARCWRAAWTSGGYGSVEPCKLFPAAPLHPPRRPMRRRRLLSRRPKPTFLRARPCRCVRATSNGS